MSGVTFPLRSSWGKDPVPSQGYPNSCETRLLVLQANGIPSGFFRLGRSVAARIASKFIRPSRNISRAPQV